MNEYETHTMTVLLHVVIMAVVITPYLVFAAAAEFRSGWRAAVDVAMLLVFLIGGCWIFAIVGTMRHDVSDASAVLMLGVGLMSMGCQKLLFLTIAPFYSMESKERTDT